MPLRMEDLLEPRVLLALLSSATPDGNVFEGRRRWAEQGFRAAGLSPPDVDWRSCSLDLVAEPGEVAEMLSLLGARGRCQAPLVGGNMLHRALEEVRTWRVRVEAAVRLLVHTVLWIDDHERVPGGASSALLPGVLWVRPGRDPTPGAIAETLVHEAVHQALNLLDATIGVFRPAAFDSPQSVVSPVRTVYPSGQEPIRTFWAAVHAWCVAYWLVRWHRDRDRRRAEAFRQAMSRAAPQLRALEGLLTPVGRRLVWEAPPR